jgi:hypothetical protein
VSGRKPTRDLDALHFTHHPPGAEKEKVKERAAAVPLSCEYDHIPYVHEQWGGSYREEEPPEPPRRKAAKSKGRPYAELRAASSFSFLDGASLPEDLIATAAEKDLPVMALLDRNGVYGAPRFFSAAKKAGVKAIVGAELVLDHDAGASRDPSPGPSGHPLPASGRGEGTQKSPHRRNDRPARNQQPETSNARSAATSNARSAATRNARQPTTDNR